VVKLKSLWSAVVEEDRELVVEAVVPVVQKQFLTTWQT
jgi:hypothetical protein